MIWGWSAWHATLARALRRLSRDALDVRGRDETASGAQRASGRGARLRLAEFDLCLSREGHAFFLAGRDIARSLQTEARAHFSLDDDDHLRCRVGGVDVTVRSLEELYILSEIYVHGVYNIATATPLVVWDIGMNVGFASLYFAMRDGVYVVGHEPLRETYHLACDNLRLNPQVARKIRAFNYGIGGADHTETVTYCQAWKGSVGTRGVVGDVTLRGVMFGINERNTTFTDEEIVVKNASDVLRSILSEYPGLPVVAKIDCEGAEYEIIAALHEEGLLPAITAIMMEWHRDGPHPLMEHLAAAGFTTFSLRPESGQMGMIYAVQGGWRLCR